MLYPTPALDAADRRVLDEIAAMRRDLEHYVRPQQRWTRQLRRNLTARAIAGSNTIEGYAATVDDVEALMVGESPLDTDEETRREIEGYRRAMTYIQALSDAGPSFRYDTGLLNGLHYMIQEHRPEKRPGRLRKGPVYISHPDDKLVPVYTAPDAADVPAYLTELVDWLNGGDLDMPVEVRASMAHLNLVKIHPWADGNGRMSRALSTLVFSREALMPAEFSSIEEWLGRGQNTFRYYSVLEAMGGPTWKPAGTDTSAWVKFCLEAHHRQAQGSQRRVELLSRAWGRLVDAAEESSLEERAAYALLPAFLGQKVRRKLYQLDAELSDQQSIRDIRQMVALKWLVAHGEARGRYYTAGPRLSPLVADVQREVRPFRSPYQP
ncbi:Fic family protein [Actinacidiphila epipremni]|uniref:Fic family protein n=1 Tax=Actinacidiphila epipremni TaxID=2053013 RepID=A0ABX0ZHB2_9ACTN|nr:Fic family protein [Actinacidiphila epipremni]NJP43120.1 Fic family protein [Actinacidiphila epipremni]